MNRISATAPAKVNLAFKVGPLKPDGFHNVASAYLGLTLRDRVTLSHSDEWQISVSGTLSKNQLDMVPLDESNLAVKAIKAVAAWSGQKACPTMKVEIDKNIPVAGGMAGGSADAAAALVAANEFLKAGFTIGELQARSVELGSDVPFSLHGGFALGTGRGEILQKLELGHSVYLVFAVDESGLSTRSVYQKLDQMRVGQRIEEPVIAPEFLSAAASGDSALTASLVENDLQPIALAMRPVLAETLEIGAANNVLAGFVSGSGPTIAFICRDEIDAEKLQASLNARGIYSFKAQDSSLGAMLEVN